DVDLAHDPVRRDVVDPGYIDGGPVGPDDAHDEGRVSGFVGIAPDEADLRAEVVARDDGPGQGVDAVDEAVVHPLRVRLQIGIRRGAVFKCAAAFGQPVPGEHEPAFV